MPYLILDKQGLSPFIQAHEIKSVQPQVNLAHRQLTSGIGSGSQYLGWMSLPQTVKSQLSRIKSVAEEIRGQSKTLVVIGIGGSYLGASAALEALGKSFPAANDMRVFFAGNNLSSTYHAELLATLADTDFSINIISKSGTTTEPAIAFRLFRELLERKYGQEEARRRIYATTDAQKGALRTLADQEGYTTFVIPDDVGGRYSVLTPVGLLPMAVAGIDIEAVVQGAELARQQLDDPNLDNNPCYQYAAIRNILHNKGKSVELLAAYEPKLRTFAEWWKQLFGESEGKDQKGIFPASAIFSTDLHSLGQFVQDGSKVLFETVLKIEQSEKQAKIPHQEEDLDQLNYLAGKDMEFVNDCAFRGTLQAHTEGQVPNIVLRLPDLAAHSLGYLFYFMEKACAISGYMLGVNPFDQPGVEAYKRNMFQLLGKPRR